MIKSILKVPSYVKYISDWKGYEIPEGKCIIDKKVCGCGYTQFCLTNKDNIILCSPRISLLENKAEQNPQCYYFKPIIFSKKEMKKIGLLEEDISSYTYNLQVDQLEKYLIEREVDNLPVKILITYDSFPKLLEILYKLNWKYLNEVKVIIDEFHLIFNDARFKAGVELDFIEYLDKYCKNIVYLSGTPMLETYLNEVPEFKNLKYYELIWDESRLSSINITRISTVNLEKSAIELVNLYKSGHGPIKIINGNTIQSKEAVLFVNNVSMITEIIKGSHLTADEVNIIVSRNSDNLKKIKRCGREFGYGRVPIRGEKHKLVTLCSSTAYCGIDMYSETAKAYIFSNCNLKTMSVDISLELPQIVGRQRLDTNVFKRDITIYYTKSINDYSKEDFNKEIESKIKKTNSDISMFSKMRKIGNETEVDNLRNKLRFWICGNGYTEDYTSISKDSGEPTLNHLMLMADIRSWELQNLIYRNDKSILTVLEEVGYVDKNLELSKMLEISASFPDFKDRLNYINNYVSKHPEERHKIPEEYLKYIDSGVIENSLRKSVLDKKLIKEENRLQFLSDPEVINIIREKFKRGKVYTKKETKEILNEVVSYFDKYSDKVLLKATDITLFFNIGTSRLIDPITHKSCNAIKILSIKEN